MPAIVEIIVYQHAENVCSLWSTRQSAVDQPHYSYFDLLHLDSRVDANLDGLRIAGHHAVPFIEEMIAAEDEGAYFTRAVLALEGGDATAFSDLVDIGEGSQQVMIELESALAWVEPGFLKNIAKQLLTSDLDAAVILGLKTCASHNRDPGIYLDKHLRSANANVRCTVMHVAANLGQKQFSYQFSGDYQCYTAKETFERARALAMLGQQGAARAILRSIALGDTEFNADAVNLYVQITDSSSGRELLKTLDGVSGRERDVVRGFGLLGDPVAMDWLIQKTQIPEISRLAGGAITTITGIDLAEQDLEMLEVPEGFADGGVNDDPGDDNVALDEDDDLPWPDPDRVAAWWGNSEKLPVGRFFLGGREKIQSGLSDVLRSGMQRQRKAAAFSLAVLNPESKYQDTQLPTSKQKVWMN